MRRIAFTLALLLLLATVSHAKGVEIPKSLRGDIKVSQKVIDVALAMQKDGWVYVMPQPKSPQARWGNTDGRTTWYVGYWKNTKTKKNSSTAPKLKDGKYVGDNKGRSGWRRGGSPPKPSKLEWLLSKGSGIKPK